jgi:hypothetical protein
MVHFSGPKAAHPNGSKTSTAPTTSAAATSRTADHLEGAADLAKMKAVMAGDHAEAQVITLRAALAMDSKPGSLFGPTAFPQRKVGSPERFEKLNQILNRVVLVVEFLDP